MLVRLRLKESQDVAISVHYAKSQSLRRISQAVTVAAPNRLRHPARQRFTHKAIGHCLVLFRRIGLEIIPMVAEVTK